MSANSPPFFADSGIASKFARVGYTFDDVLLVPAASNTLPQFAETRTWITPKIGLNIPIVSAAMDTVTEARLAIAISGVHLATQGHPS